jgi:histidine triad (HIT) family protein
MATCDYCEIVSGREPAQIIYQDKEVVAFVSYMAFNEGQITVIPTEHHTILEMIPHTLLLKMSDIINKIGMSVFDGLGATGTNIFLQNGLAAGQSIPHFSMHVIPRKEEDGLKIDWAPQELDEPTMDDAFIQITSNTEGLDVTEEEKEIIEVDGEESEVVLEKDEDDNYLIKSLRRRP